MKFQVNLPDPVFMLSLYNERVRNGIAKLHPWQAEVLMRYARTDLDYKQVINRINLVANNGAGKSAMIIAPATVWTAMRFENSRSVITSASGQQLDRQTGRAIRHMCEQVNAIHGKMGHKPWDIKYREYTFRPDPDKPNLTSTIELYATDEPGKAEGYHPHVENGVFCFATDEAKSISEALWQPIERCNGKTHWLNVSSPGQPLGFFYNACTSPRWWTRKVTAYECPHIRQDEIDGAKEMYGEQSAFFRSAYLAEFTSINELIVIPYERIMAQLRAQPSELNDGVVRAGVDLSAGGDENVVSVWRGNKQIGLEPFRVEDTRVTVQYLVNVFRKYGLKGENVFVDDGYIGRAIIHTLRDHGYVVNAVNFGSRAFNHVAYGNRGTELWMNYERHLPHLIMLDDPLQAKQLASRYYKISDTSGKIILESKREAKANGHPSPDRADATVLAFSGTPIGYFARSSIQKEAKEVEGTPEWATECLRRMANNRDAKHIPLTPEQISAATEVYRAIRQKLKSSEIDWKNSDGGEDRMAYSFSRRNGAKFTRIR